MAVQAIRTTIRDCLTTDLKNLTLSDEIKTPMLTQSSWTKSYHVGSWQAHEVSMADIVSDFGALNEEDDARVDQDYLACRRRLIIVTKGDARDSFITHVLDMIMQAFHQQPSLITSSQISQFSRRITNIAPVDYMIRQGNGIGETQIAALGMISEPGSLITDQWTSPFFSGNNSSNIRRHLRAFAIKYACTHVFCYYGRYLLMARFEASQAKDLVQGPVDYWLMQTHSADCNPRMALYLFIREGLHAVQNRSAPILRHGSWQSKYRWDTGEISWQHIITHSEVSQPRGWSKRWNADSCCWIWLSESGDVVGSEVCQRST